MAGTGGTDLTAGAREGARHAYFSSDVIVASKHRAAVAAVLAESGVGFDEVDDSTDLGLALLTLHDDRAAADAMARAVAAELGDRPTPAGPADGAADLDLFLHRLRGWFALRYAGWSPTLGKNRLVGQVIGGGGKISHGGGGNPSPSAGGLPDRSTMKKGSGDGRGVRVGVLDTSLSSHEWLSGGWVAAASDVLPRTPRSGAYAVPAGHATFVAGLVLRQAPAAVVEGRRLLSDDLGQADSWTAAKEIAAFGATRPDVLNLSFACYTEDGQPPLALSTAVDRLDPGTVVVAAAGNHGDLVLGPGEDEDDRRKPAWPAALTSVVAVGATDDTGTLATFTPPDVQWIDVLAPGVEVVSTFLDAEVDLDSGGASSPERFEGFASWSGTSFAAATVSGMVAARTRPGRVSARDAYESLLSDASDDPPFLRPG